MQGNEGAPRSLRESPVVRLAAAREGVLESTTRAIEAPDELIRLLKLSDRREPAVVEIATWVAQGIVQGRLLPGQDLNSVELARLFDSSRTPVREALAVLESHGLVEMRARRRPRVASFGAEQIHEIFVIRAELLSAVGQTAAEGASEEHLALLSSIVDDLRAYEAADDLDNYRWVHYTYFDTIVEISGNGTAKAILDSLFLRTLAVRQALDLPGRLKESLYYAELILDAFSRRDGPLVALLMKRSIQAALRAIERAGYPSDGRHERSR